MEDHDDREARHRKELKALEGERRATVKKLKGTQGGGKKAKDAIEKAEAEFNMKVTTLKFQHEQETLAAAAAAAANSSSSSSSSRCCQPQEDSAEIESVRNSIVDVAAVAGVNAVAVAAVNENPSERDAQQQPQSASASSSSLSKKQEKARQKRAKQRHAELERERRIEQETANAGPSRRDVEWLQLQQQMNSNSNNNSNSNYTIAEIPADGHCLYRAVAAQLHNINIKTNNNTSTINTAAAAAPPPPPMDYRTVRGICADRLLQHADAYAPFAELDDIDFNNNDIDIDAGARFTKYCERVRSGTEWGGHLELRALATALNRPIHIYSVAAATTTTTATANGYTVVEPEEHPAPQQPQHYNDDDNDNDDALEPIRLSYHLHYCALGEHYNQVVLKEK